MLVYGDRPRRERTEGVIADLRARLAAVPPGGIGRRAALVEAFILAAELAQGLADAEFAARGADAPSEVRDAATAVVTALARAVLGGALDADPVERLAALALPESVETKAGEGYAFYALYPEAYAEAARRSGLGAHTTVIGVRSIGTGLAAVVAAAIGAKPPITVRPIGHPFRRTLALAPELADHLRAAADGDFAVVDEGPGLSGSSFQAVAEALAAAGAHPGRIVFFPSHDGEPGERADPAWRERWRTAKRPVVSFDEFALADPAEGLQAWVEDLAGPLSAPLLDISGGAWRTLAYNAEADWPPANTYQERRKFLARTEHGAWLVKFAGLGRASGEALARAQALAAAGFSPPVAGLRHGFLVERWIEDSAPLDPDAFGRERLVDHLGRYLAFRADSFPADPQAGADLHALLEMARFNTEEALGSRAAAGFDRCGRPEELEGHVRRIDTDNRLQPWEWRIARDGRLFKADAVDHAHAHDLIGAQDLAWDVAGAVAEFDLSPAEADRLRAAAGGADPGLLALMQPCYLAFQLGACAMAAEAHAGWPQEQARLAGARDLYARRLEALLCGAGGSTRAGGRA